MEFALAAGTLTDRLELSMKENAIERFRLPISIHITSGKDGAGCLDLPHLCSQLARAVVAVVNKDRVLTEPGGMSTALKLALHTDRQTDRQTE